MVDGFVIGITISVAILLVIIIIVISVLLVVDKQPKEGTKKTSKNDKKVVIMPKIQRIEPKINPKEESKKVILNQPRFNFDCPDDVKIVFEGISYDIDVKFSYCPEFSLDGICYYNDEILVLSNGYIHFADLRGSKASIQTCPIKKMSVDFSEYNGEVLSISSIINLDILVLQTNGKLTLLNHLGEVIKIIPIDNNIRRIYGKNLEDYLDFDTKLLILTDSSGDIISGRIASVNYVNGRFDYVTM